MKIVQINATCGHGSTGVIAVEIADILKKRGHEAYIAYGQGTTDYPDSFRIGTARENKIHALWNTRVLGEEGTGTKRGTGLFLNWLDEIKPDIVQIHNLHSNCLNYEMFFTYLKEKQIPVVWSFCDCWPFTGKCTHFVANGCRKWETECGNCPQLHTSGSITWFFDKTRKMFNLKKKWTAGLKSLDIIVCSHWLKSEVQKSFLKAYPIHMIYNWIDMTKFCEIQDDTVYEKYGLNRNKKIIVSVSALWDDRTTRFADALRLAEVLPEKYQLVLIGKKVTQKELLPNMKHIDFVAGTKELSKLYSTAIAFAGFSVEDTFGKVFAEAMLCGTPCVVFKSTACPEVVGDTGYAVAPHDVAAMLEKINEIDSNGRDYYSQRCKDLVLSRYSYEDNVGKYIDIYERVYNENKK